MRDKYGGYNAVNATRCFCHVHAMRHIREAMKYYQKKPKFLKAINYILEDNLGFLTFINHQKIPLENNTVEAHFKPFIMHRNRSRFYVSPKGADIAAKIYSLMLSAKANGYTTYGYFSYLFDNIRYVDLNNKEELRKLLPYSSEIPEYYKIMTKSEIKKKIKELEAQLKQ